MNKKNKKKEFPKTGHESRTYYDRVVSGSIKGFVGMGSPRQKLAILEANIKR